MLATLRQRNFTLLWLGGLISLMGDWVLMIGLPIYVYLLTRSVLALSISLLTASIPNIVLGSVAGVFVDRWDRKQTMVITNLLSALALLPLLLVNSPAFFPFFWLTVGLFITAGLFSIAPSTGTQSLMQAKSPDAYRGRIFGALSMTMGLCGLLGTLIAGFLTDHIPLITILNIQAAVYVLAGLLVIALLPREKEAPAPQSEPVLNEQGAVQSES